MRTRENHAIEVYTDGQCPLCRWLRARVEPRDHQGRIRWIDYHDRAAMPSDAAKNLTFAEMSRAMHVRRTDNGRWATGFAACLEILGVLAPGWRLIGRLLGAWPLRLAGPLLYKFIAKRRYSLFGIPPPCDPDGACSLRAAKS